MKKKVTNHLEEQYAHFSSACKENGVKVTHQRLEIFREIADAKDHPSAEDVYNRVKIRIPSISLDTVYRTLSLFEQCKIISRIHPMEDRIRFDPNTKTHHHLICTHCKKVMDFYWPAFDELPSPNPTEEWGVVKSKTVEFWGVCSDCLKKSLS